MKSISMLSVGVLLPCALVQITGCRNDERISNYAPQYVFEVEASSGEEAEFTSERSTISCRWDRSDNSLQLSFPYEFQETNEGLTYYFPLSDTAHLRTATGISVQTFFMGEDDLVLPGYGVGYITYSFGLTLEEDPRDDIFSRVSFPLYIHDFYMPAQRVCSLEVNSVCRDLAESRVEMAAMWCEDSDATLDNMLGRDAQGLPQAFGRYKPDRDTYGLALPNTLGQGGVQ